MIKSNDTTVHERLPERTKSIRRAMKNNWRPEGWYVPPEIKPFGESGKSAWHKIDSFSFEAGADAMLEVLREKGQHITDCGSEGTVVFVPNDKEG